MIRLSLLGLALLFLPAPARAEDPSLPAGAVRRLGSLRFRHAEPVNFVAYHPDGKTILTGAIDHTLRLWDRQTGELLRSFGRKDAKPDGATAVGGIQAGGNVVVNTVYMAGRASYALSPDGKTLASAQSYNSIQLWDVATGKELTPVKVTNNQQGFVFSPDGKTLAVTTADRSIALIDIATGAVKRKLNEPERKVGAGGAVFVVGFVQANGFVFSADGKQLAISEMRFGGNQQATASVRFLSTEDGKEVRKLSLGNANASTLAFSADGKLFALAKGNELLIYPADKDKELHKVALEMPVNSLTFAPDGSTLASRGYDGAVQLWDSAKGTKLHKLDGNAAQVLRNGALVRIGGFGGAGAGREVAFSPDGKFLAVPDGHSFLVWNVGTGKEEAQASTGHRSAVTALAVSSDGKTLVSFGADQTIRLWDNVTGTETRSERAPAGTVNLAISPDAETFACTLSDGTIRIHDVRTGKEKHQLKGHTNNGATLTFSADSKTLASRGLFDRMLRVHDVAKGEEIRSINLAPENPQGNPAGAVMVWSGGYGGANNLALSRDGKTLAMVAANPVAMANPPVPGPRGNTMSNSLKLFDVATGKETRQIPLGQNKGTGMLTFAPDGRTLAGENGDGTVTLWELASGKERASFGTPATPSKTAVSTSGVVVVGGVGGFVSSTGGNQAHTTTLAFSASGDLLARKGPDGSVVVEDLVSMKTLPALGKHEGAVTSLAFSGDRKTLITGSKDTTILVWDLTYLKREAVKLAELSEDEARKLFSELAQDDAGKAFSAMRRLSGGPKSAAAVVREKVKPAELLDSKLIDDLLADLDSGSFQKRSRAKDELEKIGERAVPALQKALAGDPSLETRRRIEPILAKQLGGELTVTQIALVRALEVLERANTPETREVLEVIAKGAPGALPTRQAQAILDRLR